MHTIEQEEIKDYIKDRVDKYYFKDNINCATVMLKVLAEKFDLLLDRQVINAAIGMHGAGKYGAQCGLVEGMLMFLGILGHENGETKDEIIMGCNHFARKFESEFGSLYCKELRPEGFNSEQPPHLCANLTYRAVEYSLVFIIESLLVQYEE